MRPSDIHTRAISQQMGQPSTNEIHLNIPYLKIQSNFPRANELYWCQQCTLILQLTLILRRCKQVYTCSAFTHWIRYETCAILQKTFSNAFFWLKNCRVRLHFHWYLFLRVQLTHWGGDKMDVISQTTFSKSFSWMKMLYFWLKCHWNLFLRVQLKILQLWSR